MASDCRNSRLEYTANTPPRIAVKGMKRDMTPVRKRFALQSVVVSAIFPDAAVLGQIAYHPANRTHDARGLLVRAFAFSR